jgi:3'-phosphoadenosine 5'-phosphosulfate sulfotransferase (PAPS reductase)/FAD synthetase
MELEDYKNRYYYPRDYVNHADKMKVMSVEELATIYHLPGKVILSPGLRRVESQKREAPANLPVGQPAQPTA